MKTTQAQRINAYFSNHWQAIFASLRDFIRRPISTGLTILVIGIALAIPVIFFVFLNNVTHVSGGFEKANQISLYLHKSLAENHQQELLTYLRKRHDIAYANLITPSQGLQELEQMGSFADLTELLPDNPLPPLIEVHPALRASQPASVQLLYNELKRLPEVDSAKIDMQWVERLDALVNLATKVVDGFLVLLAITVLLVIGNTLRLAVQNKRQEIEVLKLIGATNRFIRRPFIYSGLFYGLFGALIALGLVDVLLVFIHKPVARLASFYHVDYRLIGLHAGNVILIVLLGLVLGGLGASLSVRRQIAAIEPE